MIINRLNNILLIDDDQDIHVLNKHVLDKLKVSKSIQSAYNGLEGLEMLNKNFKPPFTHAPELILLDQKMPKMGGLNFLEEFNKMAQLPEYYHVKIIISSSEKDSLSLNTCLSYRNVIETMDKPLSQIKLKSVLKKYFPHLYANKHFDELRSSKRTYLNPYKNNPLKFKNKQCHSLLNTLIKDETSTGKGCILLKGDLPNQHSEMVCQDNFKWKMCWSNVNHQGQHCFGLHKVS
jgi:response regulator of citrate/malate metabolism